MVSVCVSLSEGGVASAPVIYNVGGVSCVLGCTLSNRSVASVSVKLCKGAVARFLLVSQMVVWHLYLSVSTKEV